MLSMRLSKRFVQQIVLDGFAFVGIRDNLLDCYRILSNSNVQSSIAGSSFPDDSKACSIRPYAQNQKAHLCAFLEHGEIEISNNQVKNAIRHFVIGRKGWLFADTL